MPVGSLEDIARIEEKLKSYNLGDKPYKAFFPLMRLKGHFLKVHRTKLSNYSRYIYLNPIEGVLISYKNTNKFPHAPNYIINLNDINTLEFMNDNRWFFKQGFYYLHIETKSKEIILYDNNLDMVNFAVNQIATAQKFYMWLQKIVKIRYNTPDNSANAEHLKNTDALINKLLKLSIPEVDKDQYAVKMNISVHDYALKQAKQFLNQLSHQDPKSAHSQLTSSGSANMRASFNKSSLEPVLSNEPFPNS